MLATVPKSMSGAINNTLQNLVPDAQYLPTPQAEYPPVGAEHRSVAVLGKGAFGEVHKALHTKTASQFAIKILSGGGESEMKEVNIMSHLCHANIIKYEYAFRLPTGQTCIVMELAINDLYTQLKAWQNGKRRSYLPLQCVQSIGRQALSGLDYLHNDGFMHRDLKPQNILVTKWDAGTDTPTIKLADFGLAGIDSEHKTFCGTDGYIAPEVIKANKRAEELQKQKDKGMKTIPRNRLLMYTNAIDIWALWKILQALVLEAPSQRLSLRGKTVLVNKEPAIRLIDQLMQDDPKRRPTAAECLKDPWMATNISSDSLLAQKRDRSHTSSPPNPTSSAGQPLRKVVRKAFEDSIVTENSSIIIMNAIWPDKRSERQNGSSPAPCGGSSPSNIEIKDRSLVEAGQMPHDYQATQLTIQPEENGRLPLTTNGNNDALTFDFSVGRDESITPAILANNANPQEGSPSMHDVARRLLAALQAEGYGNNVTIAGNSTDVGIVHKELSQSNISSIQVRQESEGSIMLRFEFENEEWTGNFWNEGQFPVNRSIGLQSAGPANRNNSAAASDALRPRSLVQILFNQVRPASFLDKPRVHWQEPVGAPDQFSMPTITLNDGAITSKTLSVTQPSISSIGNNSSWSSETKKRRHIS